MKIRAFLAVVPRAMRIIAVVLGLLVITAGLIGGAIAAHPKTFIGPMALYWTAAMVLGILTALWLLGIGFVFADARRRGMHAALWAAVVILFPHLLGFLLYFVLRTPILACCAACGRAVSPALNFCPHCGAPQPAGDATNTTLKTP